MHAAPEMWRHRRVVLAAIKDSGRQSGEILNIARDIRMAQRDSHGCTSRVMGGDPADAADSEV